MQIQSLLLALPLGLAAPGHPVRPAVEPTRLHVVATLGVLGDLTRQVGGDDVTVEVLADPRQDPHYVEPRPTLMQKVRGADVLVEVGLQLELWADKVADGSGNPKIQRGQPGRVIASAGIATLELPQVLSREWGDVHPYGNPHVWLDPLNAKDMAETIAKALVVLDPEHAEGYRLRLGTFQARVDEALFGRALVEEVGGGKLARLARQGRLDDYLAQKGLAGKVGGWSKQAEPLRGRPIVTYHKTAVYLAARFGFRVPIEIEEKPGIPPSARHRDRVLEILREQGVRTILQEIFYERSAAEYLAARSGANVVALPIDVGVEVGAKDYFALIDLILEKLVQSETRRGG
jgi:zinc/manganese transport system substrate-binding protein